MIQRIQTVYLFLSAAVMISLFFLPLVEMVDEAGRLYVLDLHGFRELAGEAVRHIMPVMPLSFLVGVAAAVSLATIFFYRNRIMQIRLSVFNILIQIGFYPLFFYYHYQAGKQIEAASDFRMGVILPVISIILVFLATRGIRKDEMLVKSYERFR